MGTPAKRLDGDDARNTFAIANGSCKLEKPVIGCGCWGKGRKPFDVCKMLSQMVLGKMVPDRGLRKFEDNADLDYSITCSIDIRINTGDDGRDDDLAPRPPYIRQHVRVLYQSGRVLLISPASSCAHHLREWNQRHVSPGLSC